MDTAMLRISPSFLTKPSVRPAKNNITCSLCFGLRPPGEAITGGGGVDMVENQSDSGLRSCI